MRVALSQEVIVKDAGVVVRFNNGKTYSFRCSWKIPPVWYTRSGSAVHLTDLLWGKPFDQIEHELDALHAAFKAD